MSETAPASRAPATEGHPARRELLEAIAGVWWLLLLRGMLLIFVGVYALFVPGLTLTAYAWVLGLFVLADGVLGVMAGVMGWAESRGWALARGAISILAGLFVIAHPALVGVIAVTVLVVIIGIQFLISGALEIYVAIRERKEIDGGGWMILGGIFSILFGVLLLVAPLLMGDALVRVLGVFAIIGGSSLIFAAFRLRTFKQEVHEHAA